MANKVGAKGQIVIDKEIRDQLGIQPGWLAIQRVVEGHLEVRFLPAPHDRSLAGILSGRSSVRVPPEAWDEARDRAWEVASRTKMAPSE